MADSEPGSQRGNGEVDLTGTYPWLDLASGSLASLGEIFAAVLDTSVVTGDVIKAVRAGLPSPLFLAMRTGLIRGFMAHHTWAEVPRVLARRAEKEGFDLRAAEKLWWGSYVEVIRFVSTADVPLADSYLERALGGRDASDVPTLRLASLIAPVVVLASDRDLQDIGLAYERWWDVPEVVRRVVAARGGTDLAARAVFGAGYGTIAAVRGLARALQRPPVAIAAASVLVVGFLSRNIWYPYAQRGINRLSPPVRKGISAAGQAVVGVFREYGTALSIWQSAQRGQRGSTLTHRVARILSTSPKPMTRTEITRRLGDDVARHGHRVVMDQLYFILNRNRAFCETSRGRWQLGKERANIAGLAVVAGSGADESMGPEPNETGQASS
jgi:hypothetical protein